MLFVSTGTGILGNEESRRSVSIMQHTQVRCARPDVVARIVGSPPKRFWAHKSAQVAGITALIQAAEMPDRCAAPEMYAA